MTRPVIFAKILLKKNKTHSFNISLSEAFERVQLIPANFGRWALAGLSL